VTLFGKALIQIQCASDARRRHKMGLDMTTKRALLNHQYYGQIGAG